MGMSESCSLKLVFYTLAAKIGIIFDMTKLLDAFSYILPMNHIQDITLGLMTEVSTDNTPSYCNVNFKDCTSRLLGPTITSKSPGSFLYSKS